MFGGDPGLRLRFKQFIVVIEPEVPGRLHSMQRVREWSRELAEMWLGAQVERQP